MRRAQFPWYDFSFLENEYECLWSILRGFLHDEGIESLPAFLDKTTDLDSVLMSPELLCSQTCGFDIAVDRPAPLTMIFAPSYSAPGCGAGTYSSFVVVREDSPFLTMADLRSARFIANDDRSWSGYHCMRELFGSFSDIQFSGSHSTSLKWLSSREAEVAAIDCIVWELLLRHRPQSLAQFRVIGRTPEVPAPPFVTRASVSFRELAALQNALKMLPRAAESRDLCKRLLIKDFVSRQREDYAFMAQPVSPSHQPSPADMSPQGNIRCLTG